MIEEIEHTADWAIHVRGRDLAELFTRAAQGMYALVTDLSKVRPLVERKVALESFDAETLLVDWLGELLWYTESEGLVFSQFEVQEITPTRLQAIVRGEVVSDLEKQIKAVTFHNLAIHRTEEGYEVTIVFDV
ncbi:MAG: archease [Chloroflexi bacterium]|nr:MAG: archease [Chloroflexota bacterium]